MLREAQMKDKEMGSWFIWSIDDDVVSCLPYNHTDDMSMFIWDLKHFPKSDVLNA